MKSSWLNCNCGVPQGSTLKPLLFLIYINDLSTVTNLKIQLFGDDAILSHTNTNPSKLHNEINKKLSKVDNWMKANQLTINYKKTNYMIFAKKRINQFTFTIQIGQNKIVRVNKMKYLGVMMDDTLSWKQHVNYLNPKIARGSRAISKIRSYVNIKTLRTLYYCLIYLHLQYCISSWGRASQTTFRPLKTTQKRILRIITRSLYCMPSTPLFSELELLKLDDIYKLKIAIAVHNKHNGNWPGKQMLVNLTNLHDHNARLSSKLNFLHHQSIRTQANPSQYFQELKYGMRSPETKSLSKLKFKKTFQKFLLQKYQAK